MSHGITEKCNGCGACARICPAGAIIGEKKRPHAVLERACIDCGACGRVCPQNAVIDAQGILCRLMKRSEWPKPSLSIENCMACRICVEACPAGCLAMSETARPGGVDAYPYLKDEKGCMACGFCQQECPAAAMTMRSAVT